MGMSGAGNLMRGTSTWVPSWGACYSGPQDFAVMIPIHPAGDVHSCCSRGSQGCCEVQRITSFLSACVGAFKALIIVEMGTGELEQSLCLTCSSQ